MKILLTGANGQVGWELQRTLAPLGEIIALDRAALDLSNAAALRACVQRNTPNLIVNAAAYTAVDQAEREPELAMAINGTAPGVLAQAAAECSAVLIHYSTDYVFAGNHHTPYREDDPTAPQNIYGHSKLAGEAAIRASEAVYVILRTAWVYAARGKNFLLTVQRLAQQRPELRIVADQYGAPTWARLIAEATAQIVAQGRAWAGGHALNTGLRATRGTYHLTCAGQASWHDFAIAILDELSPPTRPTLTAITTADYPTPAQRPAYSVLDNRKLCDTFGIVLPDWRAGLAMCAADLTGASPRG